MRSVRFLTLGLAITLFMLISAVSASAADKFRYDIEVNPATDSGTAHGYVTVSGLDTTKSATIRVLRLGVPLPYTQVYASAPAESSFGAADITSGDVIEVQQPTATVAETFTLPAFSLTGTAGSAAASGQAPDGAFTSVTYSAECFSGNDRDIRIAPQGGAFALTYPRALVPGSLLELHSYSGKGDELYFRDRIPGESPCMEADAFVQPLYAGALPDPTPFRIYANDMRGTVAPSARIVLRRAGAAIIDYSDASASDSISYSTAIQPQAGDVIELYRPQAAPAPTSTFTIPGVSSIFDKSNSLVAVDAPAASAIQIYTGSLYAMYSNGRSVRDSAAGRTIFDFKVPQDGLTPIDLSIPDFITADWYSLAQRGHLKVGVVPGDLSPPALAIKLAKKFKLKKLGSKVPLSVSASEPVQATIRMTLPAKLKGTKSSKTKSPTIVASAKLSLKAGTTKLKLKITKAGKKVLKRIRKQRLPNQTATVTVTATDAAGNSATTTKTTKLAAK